MWWIAWIAPSILVLMLAASSGCDNTTTPCPEGVAEGQPASCTCGDLVGTATCQADNTLGRCTCPKSGSTDGSDMTNSGARKDSSGGGANAGNGGGTPGTHDEDAGTAAGGTDAGNSGETAGTHDEDAGTTGGSASGGSAGGGGSVALRMDGNQLGACDGPIDCNMGLGCYNPAPSTGVGFCSKTCSMDSDCPSGASYTCPAATGADPTKVCVIDCTGADDSSCPSGMQCTALPTTGGMTTTYRCLYPQQSGGNASEWERCMVTSDCQADLYCAGVGGFGMTSSQFGTCVRACSTDTDCTSSPSSGSIDATCLPSLLTGGGPLTICGLSCSEDSMGCPTGMTCISIGLLGSYCYQM